MNEPLDWEKWSSFSHNRTLEDVQKYSRPGAVAEKKAFFEAHYKKIAAKKAPNKENKPPNSSDDPTSSTPVTSPLSDDPMLDNNKNVCSPPTRSDDPISSTPVTNPVSGDPMSNNKDVCSPPTRSDDPISSTTVTSPVFDDPMSEYNKDVCSPPTRSDYPISSTTVTSPVSDDPMSEKNKDVCSTSTNLVEENMTISFQVEQEKGSPENVCLIEMKDEMLLGQTKPEMSLAKSSRKAAASPSTRPRIIKAARDVTQKKRSAPQSLNMSMNFPPAGIKNRSTLTKPKDAPNLKVLPITEKRSHPEASCTKKPRSSSTTTVASSFSFRSDERAAKRKEFFQKLEEKDAGKIQLQPKSKARNENKKLRQSSALPWTNQTKAPTSTKTFQTKLLSSMSKVPPPKLGKQVQDSCQSSKPKNFIEINKKKLLTSSTACLPTKKMHMLQRNNVK